MSAMQVWIGCTDQTPLGTIWVAVSEGGLVAVEIGAEQENFQRMLERKGFRVSPDPERTAEAARQISEYLAGGRRVFDLPLDWTGVGAFQQAVLRCVVAIPYGKTVTYGQIAREMGRPYAARAAGRANATNPIALVIPCHRVIGSDGKLHGYGAPGGIETKRWLLDLEGGRQPSATSPDR